MPPSNSPNGGCHYPRKSPMPITSMAMEQASFKVLEELERMAQAGQHDHSLLCNNQ